MRDFESQDNEVGLLGLGTAQLLVLAESKLDFLLKDDVPVEGVACQDVLFHLLGTSYPPHAPLGSAEAIERLVHRPLGRPVRKRHHLTTESHDISPCVYLANDCTASLRTERPTYLSLVQVLERAHDPLVLSGRRYLERDVGVTGVVHIEEVAV